MVVKMSREQETIIRNNRGNKYFYVRIQILVKDNISYILLLPDEPRLTPYQIENTTEFNFVINQKNCSEIEMVPPKSTLRYTWSEVSKPHIVQLKIEGNDNLYNINFDSLKKYKPHSGEQIQFEVTSHGTQKILRITPVKQYKHSYLKVNNKKFIFLIFFSLNFVKFLIIYFFLKFLFFS